MLLPKLQIALGALSIANAFQLKDAAEFEVKRDLLEQSYPAYKSFRGAMHAGLMPAANIDDESVGDDYSSYFFWLFQPEKEQGASDEQRTDETFRNDTLLIWINGGPGCSSMVGLLGEMGPVGIPKFGPGIPAPNPATVMDAPLVENQFAWTKKSAMLFVEQPGGTGFSTASSQWMGDEADKRTEDDVASAFWDFLQNIYTVFGDELVRKKLYLSGESYAGIYIPSIARGIHLRNKQIIANEKGYPSSPSSRVVNLRGLAIGNGWIDAMIQGASAIDYAWWHGMIDLNTYRGLHDKWDECMAGKIVDLSEKPFHPFTTPDECGIAVAVMEASGSKFEYDVSTYDAYPAVLDVGGTISNFMNDPIVRESLNAPSIGEQPEWLSCVPGSGRRSRRLENTTRQIRELIMLDNDRPLSVVPYIAELLDDAHLDVLLYNGDLDLACGAQGTELALESMDWSGKQKWLDPDTTKWHQWNVDGQPAGHTKKFNNLEFLVVYNSGHFVPINQARNSLNMIGRLLDGKSFGDKKLKQFAPRPEKSLENDPTSEGDDPSTEETHASKGTHGLSLLTGLVGFVLGFSASHFISKRPVSSKLSESSSSSIPSSPFLATETTSLRHTDT